MSCKHFPREFTIEAVKQVVERGHSVSCLATRHGINPHGFYAWIKAYEPGSSSNKIL
ncbi:transposase, partial [Cronobacter sakazakii]|uniref:transposase n=1 Tax=Cronobacter sakazakii TaxID=28141 RepID=UPI003F7AF0F9